MRRSRPAAAGGFSVCNPHEAQLPSRQLCSPGAALRFQGRANGRDGGAHGGLWPPSPPVTCSRLRLVGGQHPAHARPALSLPPPRRAPQARPPAAHTAPAPAQRGGGERAPPHPGASALSAHARPPHRCEAGRRGRRRCRCSSLGRCASALSGKGERA